MCSFMCCNDTLHVPRANAGPGSIKSGSALKRRSFFGPSLPQTQKKTPPTNRKAFIGGVLTAGSPGADCIIGTIIRYNAA